MSLSQIGRFFINNIALNEAMTMLKDTSRTFYIPISYLDVGIKEAVASAYLCMRAIDEIEDHNDLSDELKVELLLGISEIFESQDIKEAPQTHKILSPYRTVLPAVSMQLDDWALLCPPSAASIVYRKDCEQQAGRETRGLFDMDSV